MDSSPSQFVTCWQFSLIVFVTCGQFSFIVFVTCGQFSVTDCDMWTVLLDSVCDMWKVPLYSVCDMWTVHLHILWHTITQSIFRYDSPNAAQPFLLSARLSKKQVFFFARAHWMVANFWIKTVYFSRYKIHRSSYVSFVSFVFVALSKTGPTFYYFGRPHKLFQKCVCLFVCFFLFVFLPALDFWFYLIKSREINHSGLMLIQLNFASFQTVLWLSDIALD